MANLDATILVKYQDYLATSESRRSPLGIINLVKNSTPFCDYISPDLIQKFAEFSSERPFTIPTILPQSPIVVTTPGFEFIPDNLTESAEHTFTMYDVFSGFRHYPSLYANNVIKADFDLQVKLDNVLYAMGNSVEEILSTKLNARKSQVLDHVAQLNYNSGGGTYAFTGSDILTINVAAQQATMFLPLNELMMNNELGGNYAVVTSPGGLINQKLEAMKYGMNNDKNVASWGMLDASDIHNSQNISTSAVFDGYYVRKGAIGMYPNFPYDFRNGSTLSDSKWYVSDMEMPYLKHAVNVFTREFTANASGLSSTGADTNTLMTKGEEMAIWFRFVAVFRPNSELPTRANDVLKIQGSTT
jgi:hypothetical protein